MQRFHGPVLRYPLLRYLALTCLCLLPACKELSPNSGGSISPIGRSRNGSQIKQDSSSAPDPLKSQRSEEELRTSFKLFVQKSRSTPTERFIATDTARALLPGRKARTLNIKMRASIESSGTGLQLASSESASLSVRAAGGVIKRLNKTGNFLNVEFPEATDDRHLSAVIDFLKTDSRIAIVEPDYVVKIVATPNDPNLDSLWGLRNTTEGIDIKAAPAWDLTTGSRNVVVGVIDSGIDCEHPELKDNCWINPGESGLDAQGHDKRTNKIDDDGNGFVDDWQGWDFIENDNVVGDANSHGTHVAGTIGAIGNNARGVVGVNWQVSLVPLRFLNSSGSGYTSDAIEAVDYAAKMKFFATNNSWGGGAFSQLLAEAIKRASDAGVMFIVAAGNDSRDNDSFSTYPANYDFPNVYSVAAIDRSGTLAWFSNYGAKSVDIAAPGVDIFSTIPGDSYSKKSGTSMATPHVVGALALLKARFPNESGFALMARLIGTVSAQNSLVGKVRSSGILNVYAAMTGAQDTIPPSAPTKIMVGSRTTNFSSIEWTPSGDDDTSGAAQAYDARIAANPIISSADWDNAISVNLDISTASQTGIRANIRDLPLGFQGWIALRARDEAGNVSPLSETVNFNLLPLRRLQFHDGTNLKSLPTTPWVIETDPERGAVFSDGVGLYEPNSNKALTLPDIPLKNVHKLMLTFWQRASLERIWDSGNVIVTWDGKTDETIIDWVDTSTSGWQKQTLDLSSYIFTALAAGARSIRISFVLKSDKGNQFDGWLLDDIEVLANDSLFTVNGIPTGPTDPGEITLSINAPSGSWYTSGFSEGETSVSNNCSEGTSYGSRWPNISVTQPLKVTQTSKPRKFLCLFLNIPNYNDYLYGFFEWNLKGAIPDVKASGMPTGTSNLRQFTFHVAPDGASTPTTFSYAMVKSSAGQEKVSCSNSDIRWSQSLSLTTSPVIDLMNTYPDGADGYVALCVRGTDSLGNIQNPPAAYGWVVDLTPPELMVTPQFPSYVNNKNQTFTVSTKAGAADIAGCFFKVSQGIATCPADLTGYSACRVVPASNILALSSDGPYTLCVTARDSAGNASPVQTSSFILDTIPPTVTLSGSPPISSKVPRSSIKVAGADVATYRFATAQTTSSCTNWSAARPVGTAIELTVIPGGDGPQALCVKGADLAGNEQSVSINLAWTQDSTVNPLKFGGPLPGSESNATSLFTSVVADEDGTYRFSLTAGSACNMATLEAAQERSLSQSISASLAGSDGSYTLCAVMTDKSGNTQSLPTSYSWIKDTVAPTAAFAQTPAKTSSDPAPVFKVAGSGVLKYQWALTSLTGTTACNSVTYSSWTPAAQTFTANLTTLGTKTTCLRGVDAAGNIQKTATMYTWTFTRPSAPVATIASGAPFSPASKSYWSIKISGERVSEWQHGTVYSNTTDCKSGVTWTAFQKISDLSKNPFTLTDTKTDGFRTLCVRGRDVFGSVQTTPTILRWVKHADAPSFEMTKRYGTLTRQTGTSGVETITLTRSSGNGIAETVSLRLCLMSNSSGLFSNCRAADMVFDGTATSKSNIFTAVTTGTWTVLAFPPTDRGSLDPLTFKK